MEISQNGRYLKIETPLGKDKMLLVSFRGEEEISGLFEFDLELLSSESRIEPKDIVGQPVCFRVEGDGGDTRFFSGFVATFGVGGGAESGLYSYKMRLVPWLWFLGTRSDCRVFQDMSVPEIVEAVFSAAGFEDYELGNIQGSYPPREYCVQLRETDLQFVSRLLEEVGIYYFFRFEEDRHVLVLADGTVAYQDISSAEFMPGILGPYQVDRWEHQFEFITGTWSYSDFNFKTPTTKLFVSSSTVVDLPAIEGNGRYDYPGGYAEKAVGESRAQARMVADEAGHDVVGGGSGCLYFCLGGVFELTGSNDMADVGSSFVLTKLEHGAADGSNSRGGGQELYSNSFRCIPSSVPFAPQRKTPKPVVSGLQTAIVVGPGSDEIYTDEYGRVKVQFHWDVQGKYDDASSCWIRVMQSVAGKKWGFQSLPRVGQEVICEFLDGDPDRPLVVGAVYNGNTMPAYDLPANKTQSGWRSRSTPNGAAGDCNELRFEDKAGAEHIFVHAQKDEHHRVKNDRHDHVGNDEHNHVVGKRFRLIDKDDHLTIKGDQFSIVEGAGNIEIKGASKVKIGGDEHRDVGSDHRLKTGGDLHLGVGGSQHTKAAKDLHREAGKDVHEKAGMNMAMEGGMDVHIKAGMNVVIEAGASITLKAGGAKLVVGPANIDIVGAKININSGGGGGAGKGCKPKAPAKPAAPAKPEEPVDPMDILAAADADPYSSNPAAGLPGELKWLTIEKAWPTPQAAVLEFAAESGEAFCET